MMKLWESLLSRLGYSRTKGRLYFELDENLHTALMDLAEQEQRPAEEVRRT